MILPSHDDALPSHGLLPESTADLASHSPSTRARIANILDEYLAALESGRRLQVEDVLAAHPDLADVLHDYLLGIECLHQGCGDAASTDGGSDSPLVGQQLGDFTLLQEIGRGGMGVVYAARQRSLERTVALKVLPFAAMLDRRQIARFENEARAAGQLHHAHIVPVYGVGCERGVHFYAMQLIEGKTLREATHDRVAAEIPSAGKLIEPWSPREVALIGLQASQALHAAHQCGVVHRDIKPSNLLLEEAGHVWVADFGLARVHSNEELTRDGDIVGTLHYMSPEQLRGNAVVADPRTDVYSLAVTLYELLTLRRPFDGESHAEILRQIEHGVCRPLRAERPNVPRDLAHVIAKAMQPDPADRYPDAAQFAADLQRFVDGRPTFARRPSALQTCVKWAARNRVALGSAAVSVVVLLIALSGVNLWLWGQRRELEQKNVRAGALVSTLETSFERFGLQAVDVLKQLPHSAGARQELLQNLLDQYETLLVATEGATDLQSDAAIALTKQGHLHRELGNRPAALEAYRRAADIWAHFASRSPSNRDYEAHWAACQSSAGLLLAEMGDPIRARRVLDEAIACQRRLLQQQRRSEHAVALAHSLVNLSSLEDNHLGGPSSSWSQAQVTLTSALRSDPASADVLSALAALYGQRSLELAEADPARALSYAEQSVRYAEALVSARGEAREPQQILATQSSNLGALQVANGNLTRAIQAFELAATYQRKLSDDASLVTTLSNLANTQHRQGNVSAAIAAYREAADAQRALLLHCPADLGQMSRLGGLWNNLAFLQQSQGEYGHAEATYARALTQQQRAFRLAPEVVEFRDALSRTLFNSGRVALQLQCPQRAATLQWRRAKLWPDDAEQLLSAEKEIRLACSHLPAGHPQEALWQTRLKQMEQRRLHSGEVYEHE